MLGLNDGRLVSHCSESLVNRLLYRWTVLHCFGACSGLRSASLTVSLHGNVPSGTVATKTPTD
ncbi:hypothetical protein D3C81_720500 [compost metagenome]